MSLIKAAMDLEVLQTQALEQGPVPCAGNDRFTADEVSDDELFALNRDYCIGCPVRRLCATYGAKAKPLAGVWAGVIYPKDAKPRTASNPTERNPR